MIRLDAIITNAIDSLPEAIVHIEAHLRYTSEKNDKNRSCFQGGDYEKDLKVNTKNGCISQKVVEKLRALLPLASSQLLQKCHDVFESSCRGNKKNDLAELSLNNHETSKGQIDNTCRENTLVFQYPENEHFYICLKFQAFSQRIFSWIGAVQDCYILHTQSLRSSFKTFSAGEVLELVNDSDEDGEPDGSSMLMKEGHHLIINTRSSKNNKQPMWSQENTIVSESDCDDEILPTRQVFSRSSIENSRSS